MSGFQLTRLPENREELYWTVRALWDVTIPSVRVCENHIDPMTAFSDAYFGVNSINPERGHNSRALWLGSRGLSGKSKEMSVLGLTKAALLGSDVSLLGGSLAQSKNIHDHIRAALWAPNSPRGLIEVESSTLIKFGHPRFPAHIYPLTASQTTVRGPHPPTLLCDEIDEMKIDILAAALGQPLRQRNYLGGWTAPYTVLCSTWQHPEGPVTQQMREAEERGYPLYQWCYRESANPVDGWLTDEAIEEKRRTIPKAMWDSEYEMNEPSIGNRAFDGPAVDRAFSLDFAPIKHTESKDYEECVFEQPHKDGTYVAGADWGRDKDYTVIAVGRVDVEPYRLVYYLRVNRRPYPLMIGYFNDAMNKYGAHAAHDATGLGNVVDDYVDRRARKFMMTGEKRSAMLSEYVVAVEGDRWRYPKVRTPYIETKFCRTGDLYENKLDYHLPDTVCAFGLMNYMAERFAPIVSPIVVRKDGQMPKNIAMFEHPRINDDLEPGVSRSEVKPEMSFLA